MNVFLQRLLFTLLVAVAVPIFSDAQTTVSVLLETYQNQPYQYNFTSAPNRPLIVKEPTNGTFGYVEYPESFVGTYTPDEDFIGVDNFRIMVWNGPDPTKVEIKDITIEVMPAEVIANPDFGYTFSETSVSLDVLANDFSSNPSLKLKSVSVSNYGFATFDSGSPFIDFTPETGFTGEAYLNYTICDNAGICDDGIITISVVPASEPADDTIRVFTKKNQPQVVLVPQLYQLEVEPGNGVFDNQGEFPVYTPNENFIGKDYLRFAYNGSYKLVEVHVLDLVDNVVAFDDKAYTSPKEPIEINVLENDAYGLESGCFQIISSPRYGTITEDPQTEGLLTYTPFSGFRGVDVFTYTTNDPDCAGLFEEATAYIHVGNFEPSSSKYRMVTPKYTPLVIGNNVPISNFEFRIVEQGEYGQAFFLEGEADTTIYGQHISGYNMIVYAPSSTTTSEIDEFEVVYCVKSNGACVFEKSVKIEVEILDVVNDGGNEIMCIGDCVWSGDTNLDGVVNIADLLPLGLHMGSVGVPRQDAGSNVWYGQHGQDWVEGASEELAASINLKHLDTNGDSLITSQDTIAIKQFYGRTHSLNASAVPYSEHKIRLRGNFSVRPGDLIVLDMYLGDSTKPAEDVYGFTFPYLYDPNFFAAGSVGVQFGKGNFLDYNAPTLQLFHNNMNGLAEAGFTRTDNNKVSGFGKIGTVVSAILDDINGFKLPSDTITLKVGGGTATMMDSKGQFYGVDIEEVEIKVYLDSSEEDETFVPSPDQLIVYPNPARDIVNIHLNGGQDFERFVIYNATGQAVYTSEKIWARSAQVNVAQWAQGMYFVNVFTKGGVVNKKLEIVKW